MNLENTTAFPAEITLNTDKNGADSYLVVVKGTFTIPRRGEASVPAPEQVPFVYGDQHYGDPEVTSIRYESEFAPTKQLADVVFVGSAHAPKGRPARSVHVELRVGEMVKRLDVVGDRVWRSVLGVLALPSRPRPFKQMPIVYERAFGGSDTCDKSPKKHRFDQRNLVGVGLQRGGSPRKAKGRPLPNLMAPGQSLRRPGQRIGPASLGFLGRNWEPRLGHTGTYDARWKEERFPLLPEDFDERYFQGAPEDQRCKPLRGGEVVRLVNLSKEGDLSFELPDLSLPMEFRFADGTETMRPAADTLILEPDEGRFQVLWRARQPVRAKLLALVKVVIGTQSAGKRRAEQTRKRYLDWGRS